MENQASVTDSVSLKEVQSEPKKKNRQAANLGKFVHAISWCFRPSKMTHEDWERLEGKKQIAHSERSNSIHQTRTH